MIDLTDMTIPFEGILAKTTPLQRLAAAQNLPPWHHGWQWLIVAALVVLLTIIIATVVVTQFKRRLAQLKQSISGKGNRALEGKMLLSGPEIELLTRLIQQSGLTRTEPKFTLQHAFNVGMANYISSDTFCELPEDHRRESMNMIEALRSKMGVEQQRYDEENMSTHEIPVGAQITVVHIGLQDDFTVVLQDNTSEGLLVQPTIPVEFRPGQSWIMRYYDGVKVWEFTSRVSHEIAGCLLIEHSNELTPINIRRFIRVPVEYSAKVSTFRFHPATGSHAPLDFVSADVVEIGGPGLMLKTSLDVHVGDRILVMLDLEQDEIVQAVGKIRRQNDSDPRSGLHRYGVELVDLKPAQVAELMQATNTAAIQLRKKREAESSRQE